MKNDVALLDRITLVPGLLGGKPTIRSMRFLVNDILELLSKGLTEEEVVEQHPILEKEDIRAALLYSVNADHPFTDAEIASFVKTQQDYLNDKTTARSWEEIQQDLVHNQVSNTEPAAVISR